jgi:hypothetical protein
MGGKSGTVFSVLRKIEPIEIENKASPYIEFEPKGHRIQKQVDIKHSGGG